QHTDFIFTVPGEAFGFIGCLVMLALYCALLWRAISIALSTTDAFGAYVAAGITAMWLFQIFVNIGMTLGIMPVTGVPLPFLSYGGSSLMLNMACVGILQSIHARRAGVFY